jgi:single-stranded-DNA-specific exonuclease
MQLNDENLQAVLQVELELDLMEVNWDLVDTLSKFEPFGQQNQEPLFVSYEVLVTGAKKVGKDQNHWKLELVKQNKKFQAIAFSFGAQELSLGQRIDIVYNLSINQWNGNREIQLIIRDLKISS